MKGTNYEHKCLTDAGFWLSLVAAPLVPWIGYVAGWRNSTADIALFSVSIIIAALLHDLEGRIPLTDIRVAPRLVITFWAILNLGVVGGTVVSSVAALAGFASRTGRRHHRLTSAVMDVASAAAAGVVFDSALDFIRYGGTVQLPANALVSNEILAAGAMMLAAYHFVWLALNSLLHLVREFSDVITDDLAYRPAWQLAGQLVAAAAALVMFAAFGHFGIAFGLVVVPLTVLGHFAHRIHLRRLEQKTRELADASRLHLATVEALATAIDARDQVGMGHIRRTQIYAVGIGTALGLGDDELSAIRAGALLHDIGKLAVPEHILNKPGRLTAAELEKTKIHAAVGASILEKVRFPYPVVPAVKHHHECWDGSGYPDGLSGERIPVAARILSLADAYDALRGPRPFRPAVSREDACNYLRSRAGTQFDPYIVNTFLRNLRKFEAEIDILGFGYEAENSEQGVSTADEVSYVQQIKRANQEVFSLYEMARDFGSSLNLDETLSLLTQKIGEFVPYDTCLVYLVDDDGSTATAAHVEGRNSEVLRGKRVVVGEGATGYVLKKRKPVENVDPSLDFAFSHAGICEHYVGMASVPLLADEKLVGAISVFSAKRAAYEEEHLRLLETISRIAGDAISKSIRHAVTEVHAQTDPLTGLPNARGLHVQFEKELGRARRSGSFLQILMLDLDGFKAVNDTFGHKAGDTMLREIGRIIKAELRDYDFLARYGGDEFVAVIPETDSADVIELCARIEAAVGGYAAFFDGAIASVGVSVGAACFPTQGESFEQLLIAADQAMYRTKAFHKQRLARLVENAGADETREGDANIDAYVMDSPPVSEPPANLAGRDSDLIVELDESHIVVVNTVN